jgi:cysteine synthase B
MLNSTSLNFAVMCQPVGALAALVGNTPLIPLQRITTGLAPGVLVFGKAEWFNPSGSVKDRPALNILSSALASGALGDGKRLLDSTSGNMGIAYATLGASLGIGVTLAIPANASRERLAILRALGAEIIETDPMEGTDGALQVARALAAERPDLYFYANQYDNPANWLAHYMTTGPEIAEQTDGQVTHFVAGLGTSGTFTGTGRYLREAIPGIELISALPDSPFHGLEGLKHMPSAIRPAIYDESVADRTLVVATEEAHEVTLRLAREEGLFVGVSAGAAVACALKVAAALERGVVVTVLPDAGYKYLSERFWGR